MPTDTAPWIRDSEHGGGRVLISRSPWTSELAAMLQSENISALRLSYGAGFRGDSIEFVRDLPFLTSLEIYSADVQDVSPIQYLENLEVLGLEVKSVRGLSDWRPPLRIALLTWCKDLSFVFGRDTIEYLNIQNYPYEDLKPLELLQSLRRLALTSRKLKCLDGIGKLEMLEHLDLYNCPNLLSIADARAKSSIKHLEVENCRHVSKAKLLEYHA